VACSNRAKRIASALFSMMATMRPRTRTACHFACGIPHQSPGKTISTPVSVQFRPDDRSGEAEPTGPLAADRPSWVGGTPAWPVCNGDRRRGVWANGLLCGGSIFSPFTIGIHDCNFQLEPEHCRSERGAAILRLTQYPSRRRLAMRLTSSYRIRTGISTLLASSGLASAWRSISDAGSAGQ